MSKRKHGESPLVSSEAYDVTDDELINVGGQANFPLVIAHGKSPTYLPITTCLPACLPVCISLLSSCLSVCMPFTHYPFSIHWIIPCAFVTVCLLLICLAVSHYLYPTQSAHLSTSLSTYLLPTCLSACICLSTYLGYDWLILQWVSSWAPH